MTGPAAPAFLNEYTCIATNTKMNAGIRNTCSTKNRDRVSVPISVPPRSSFFSAFPTHGTSLKMLVPTVVAK